MSDAVTGAGNPPELVEGGKQGRLALTKTVLEDEWAAAIENVGARGRIKKALQIWAEHDVEMTMVGLLDANAACAKAWREWAPTWIEAETDRVSKHLASLRHMRRKDEWEKRKKDARKHKRNRSRALKRRIVDHVASKGGAIDFLPNAVANSLYDAKGMQSKNIWKVANVMRALTKDGMAKIVATGKNRPDKFVLLAS